MSKHLVDQTSLFLNSRARYLGLIVRGLAFSTIFALPGTKGVRTWPILRQAILVLLEHPDIVRIDTIRMDRSSSEILPILNVVRKRGITIKALNLHNYTGDRGQYVLDETYLSPTFLALERLHLTFQDEGWKATNILLRLLLKCENLKEFSFGYSFSGDKTLCPADPLKMGLHRFDFDHLRSLVLTNIRLDYNCFDWPMFGRPLAFLKLDNVFLQPTDLRRFNGPFYRNIYPFIFDFDDWSYFIERLNRVFGRRRTQVEVWYPWEAEYHRGLIRWASCPRLHSSCPYVKILGWTTSTVQYKSM